MVAAHPEVDVSRYLLRFRIWLALVAACVILLQASAASFAATMDHGPMLDAFGNPLCLSDSVRNDKVPGGDHAKLPSCCTFGCAVATPLLSPPDQSSLAGLVSLRGLDIRVRPERAPVVRAPDHEPGNPRAPPVTV